MEYGENCSNDRSTIAPNILDRQFEAEGQDQKWVADFTYNWWKALSEHGTSRFEESRTNGVTSTAFRALGQGAIESDATSLQQYECRSPVH